MKRSPAIILLALFTLSVLLSVFSGSTASCRRAVGNLVNESQNSDVDVNCLSRKTVEDTCRDMIASYTSDRLIYEQYKAANSTQKLEWAEQAKIRANKTAAQYNKYILLNSYVWNGDMPRDICAVLPYIE